MSAPVLFTASKLTVNSPASGPVSEANASVAVIDTVARSSLVIVPTAVLSVIVELPALLKTTEKVSSDSNAVSPVIGTVIVVLVAPEVIVPDPRVVK